MNKLKDTIIPVGCVRVTQIATKNGKRVSLSEAVADPNMRPPESKIIRANLVVNTGRTKLARLLGLHKSGDDPVETAYINRLQLGDCLVLGAVDKANNLANLGDTGLVSEITQTDGTIAGKFTYTPITEVLLPAATARYPTDGTPWAPTTGTITLSAGEYLFDDASADFTVGDLGVQLTDQITLNTATTNPVKMGIKEIVSATQLKVHNPNGFLGTALEYRIDTPGTQVLFSKYLAGNSFPVATWPVSVIVHEAALLFNDGTMFSRVVFSPNSNDLGILLQSDETNGTELSARFEWLVTI